MSEAMRRLMDHASDAMAPIEKYENNDDYVINEYMERLGTRLNILETELKYAWRALDLLSQEYIKMWERLEKLEGLLYEQQSVISQLLHFYTSGGGHMGPIVNGGGAVALRELEVIREILGNGIVEDGLEEGLDVTLGAPQGALIQELDLDSAVIDDEAFYRSLNQAYREDLVEIPSNQQLGLIWEEKEENEENNSPQDDKEEVYSSMDYREYKRDSPVCVSEQDLAQLSQIDSIDQVTMEKLNELDRLSNKLQQDSANIKQLQRKLLLDDDDVDTSKEELEEFVSTEPPSWNFSNNELVKYAKSELNSSLSYTNDSEVADAFANRVRTPTSPRTRRTCSAPFTTVTGRLAYSNAVQHAENIEAAAALQNSKNPFYCSALELNAIMASIPNPSPLLFREKLTSCSPSPSICSIRTRKDGYIDKNTDEISYTPPPLIPPPPPLPNTNEVFLGTPSIKSPKRHRTNFVATKSDSGLSSISWSSLEKSPSSPKNNNNNNNNTAFKTNYAFGNTELFLPGGHHSSAFTSVKSPCNLEISGDGYGTFVPAPAPASDINVSPRKKATTSSSSHQPIYSLAGNNAQIYTSVYTDAVQSMNYPDLIEPYENNETKVHAYSATTTTPQCTENTFKPGVYHTMYSLDSYYDTASSSYATEPPIYENQAQIDAQYAQWNQRQEIPYLELDLRNRNVPERDNNVIISQSGYVSIPQSTEQNNRKKMKRGNTLKSAMNTARNSVTQWLPEIHLPKRARSFSLPSSEKFHNNTNNGSPRKKKKHAIVSTMSGIFQKAKRKAHRTQSLSDPEPNEHNEPNEWILKRANSLLTDMDNSERSEDSNSLISEKEQVQLFQKVKKNNGNGSSSPEPNEPLEQVEPVEQTSVIFPTIGESKRNSIEDSGGAATKIPVCNPSMEFAVSRALGKYRQRQNDEMPPNYEVKEAEPLVQIPPPPQPPVSTTNSSSTNDVIESLSPRTMKHFNRFFPPRHAQQSLEIPGFRGASSHEDEDTRSTHSWRSTSRVSSRRQSTEDSIDSEDEWYCYELKKLEEMEKQTTQQLIEEPEVDLEPEVKEKMSHVLRELKMKAKVIENVIDKNELDVQTVRSAQRRRSRLSTEFESSIFAKVKPQRQTSQDVSTARQENEDEEDNNEFLKPFERDDEHSSGDTSGPDTPHVSTDDENETSSHPFPRCALIKNEPIPEEEKSTSPPQLLEPQKSSVPRITIDETTQETSGKEPCGVGSKWKLLKALKERKAEADKITTEKQPELTPEKDKVSKIFNSMMQKFYEIPYVRT